jgi:hypothetical protein
MKNYTNEVSLTKFKTTLSQLRINFCNQNCKNGVS